MTPSKSLDQAISDFGAVASKKLGNRAASGEPEDQLRAPLEALLHDLAALCGFTPGAVVAVGESSLSDLKTRPDYAVTVQGALVGFIEVKAPGKGADPRRFRDRHDKEQWAKLQSIPNLLYTDGNEFSLWRSGGLVGAIVRLEGDVASAGAALAGDHGLLALAEDFLRWEPIAPRTAKQLAELTARLCRLLRDEVTEQMERGSPALTSLATDWRRLLFPEASDRHFADGYAQAVTFGLLVARAHELPLASGLDVVAKKLGATDSLIGTALRLLTDSAENQRTLQTSLGTLVRVLDVVQWSKISKGDADAWLYFYENFLEIYDNTLRKQTGSYYTPPPVVESMVRLVNEGLRTRFGLARGLAAPSVTIADPAAGTGTYLLGVLRQVAREVERVDGAGAVPAAVADAVKRLIAFELQLGPYAVAQLRIVAELAELTGQVPHEPLHMYVTDTLANPWVEAENLGAIYQPIAESRRQANRIKREESITVVIGNPPYKEKAKGKGGWVESGGKNHPAPLNDWMPPAAWKVSAHAKHLRNLYVYFWRWATWKVFDADADASAKHGIVSFITVAGFLNGPGFQRMRDYLRRSADEIWVIDCSPEGHQPEVSSRIFEGVQQPVCIVMASRSPAVDAAVPATVRYRALPEAHRREKFKALEALALDGAGWKECDTEWRAPFLPKAQGAWATYPALDDFFVYNGSGVMPGRTWVIAPDAASLERRWERLRAAPVEQKEKLFHPHLRGGAPGDRHVNRAFANGMPGWPHRSNSVATDAGDLLAPVRYAFRSFDRQWIIPDYRLINRPNPTLWAAHSNAQVYLTVPDRSPIEGAALSCSSCIPDLHHYNGRGGRVYPLWSDAAGTRSNVLSSVISVITDRFGLAVEPSDLYAFLTAVVSHGGYASRFAVDLGQPQLRIPLTADPKLFARAVELGRRVIWLHTYGERCVDPKAGRPAGSPRVTGASAPIYPRAGAIPATAEGMPNEISYDPATRRLAIGTGYIDNVAKDVWEYSVSGKQVVKQWFSYRRQNRERPIMGDRRPPSPLGEIQPDHWLPEYTTDLIDLLHVLTALVALEAEQAALLVEICAGPLVSAAELAAAAALAAPPVPVVTPTPRPRGAGRPRASRDKDQGSLLDG